MRTDLTDEERKTIALGWADAKTSGMTQQEYAAAQGVAPRTLRKFLLQHRGATNAVARMRTVLRRALSEIQTLLDQLEADEPGRQRLEATEAGLPRIRPVPSPRPPQPPPRPRPVLSPCASVPEAAPAAPSARLMQADAKNAPVTTSADATTGKRFSWDE